MAQSRQNDDPSVRLVADWPLTQWSGVHVLAAVSGGADSVALVRALIAAKRSGGEAGAGRVYVGHVNHQLRGAASDADEAWLRDECQQWDVPLVVRRSDAAAVAAEQGDGVEAAARAERYRLLTEMAQEAGARFVVTAHTRDDQAETVLFRLVRGSGLRGLAGMQRFRTLSPSVALMRPLLGCTRTELRAWLDELGQAWREDATNADVRFARNRIRSEVLPYLREYFNAEVDAALVRTAEQADEAQQVIESLAAELLMRCELAASPAGVSLNVRPLAGQPPLLVGEVLRRAWRAAAWPEQGMTRRCWRALAELAQGPDDARGLNLAGNVLARREGSHLVLAAAVPTGLTPFDAGK